MLVLNSLDQNLKQNHNIIRSYFEQERERKGEKGQEKKEGQKRTS